MRTSIRRQLSMVGTALDFTRANPSTDAAYNAVINRLVERATRASTLAVRMESGKMDESQAVEARQQLRREISQQIRHLVRVGRVAALADPTLVGYFHSRVSRLPGREFIAATRAIIGGAEQRREQLLAAGLVESFFEKVTALVSEYDAVTTGVHDGHRDRVGAVAELAAVASECVSLVRVLDGHVRTQFASQTDTIRAWESASDVFGQARKAVVVSSPPAPVAEIIAA